MKSSALQTFGNAATYRTFQLVDADSTTQPKRESKLERSKSPLKLSVITQFFPPDYAATGQLIEELVRHLGQKDIDIKVFTGQPGYAFSDAIAPRLEQAGTVQIVRSRTTNLWGKRLRGKALNGLLFTFRTLLHLVRNCRRRDLVLLTTAPPFLPILGYLANILFGVPYLCLLYDLYPDIAVELDVINRQSWIAKAWRSLNRKVWRRSQGLIVLSPAMKQRIVDLCPEVEEKVHVIHSWADPKQIRPMRKEENWFAWRHGLVNKFTVLYSGNMGRCHDIDTIFDAALLLRDEPIQFVCIGGGAKRSALMEKIAAENLDNFLFLPYQDKADLSHSLTASDLALVSVSPGMESLVAPSKLYSSLASGRPIAVVCPPQTYIRDILEDAGCGAYFDNGDSQELAAFIRLLSQDKHLTKKMSEAARQYQSIHFTPEAIAQQYSDVLHQGLDFVSTNVKHTKKC